MANANSTGFACNLQAIGAAERPRYDALIRRVREAAHGRAEVPNGYAFELDSGTIPLPEVAEWMGMERLCCPFLTLQLSVAGDRAHWLLTLTGPEGVRALLDAAFPPSLVTCP
jgi:hypothetical protein